MKNFFIKKFIFKIWLFQKSMFTGSEKIYYLNPKNFQIEKTISVSVNGNKLIYINELEFIRGEIWANIWKSNDIITVNPLSGIVTSIFDISKISEQTEIEDVVGIETVNAISFSNFDILFSVLPLTSSILRIAFTSLSNSLMVEDAL